MLGEGITYIPRYWDRQRQMDVLDDIVTALEAAPFFRPTMPRSGQPWSIRMSNMGPLGWVSDRQGYRYQADHPETGAGWPPISGALLELWASLTGYNAPPECCLINYYDQARARMGLHQDRDERAEDAPVLSISLGDSAVFRMGGSSRRSPTQSVRLHSGDVFLFGGPARHHFHGIDRILFGSSTLLADHGGFPEGGRLNLTLRRVTRPEPVASTQV